MDELATYMIRMVYLIFSWPSASLFWTALHSQCLGLWKKFPVFYLRFTFLNHSPKMGKMRLYLDYPNHTSSLVTPTVRWKKKACLLLRVPFSCFARAYGTHTVSHSLLEYPSLCRVFLILKFPGDPINYGEDFKRTSSGTKRLCNNTLKWHTYLNFKRCFRFAFPHGSQNNWWNIEY